MSADVAGSDVAKTNGEVTIEQVQTVQDADSGNVNGELSFSQPLTSVINGLDEPSIGEVNNVSDPNIPKDAADEWPETYKVHSFYFVKCRPYDDPKLKAKLNQADKEFQKKKQQISRIIQDLKAKKSERAQVFEQLKPLNAEKRQHNKAMEDKMKEIKPLQDALGSLRGSNNPNRERGTGLCSSEEELNALIRSLQYRIEHESIPLTEEKQLMREIKQLEGTRESVIANAAVRVKIQDSLGQRESIQEQVKLIGTDLDGVRKERQATGDRIKYLEERLTGLKDEIIALEEELNLVDEKKREILETIDQLRGQRDVGNKSFHDYRRLVTDAKVLAANKDIKAVKELSHTSGEDFCSRWNNSKAFRDDYEKRLLQSLDNRQFSRDGRIRNPDEKPLVSVEPSVPASTEMIAKKNPKPVTEEPKPAAAPEEKAAAEKVSKESKKKTVEPIAVAERVLEEEEFVVEKTKDLEKKLKKKNGGSGLPTNEEDTSLIEEPEAKSEEAEKVEEDVEASAPVKRKEPKEVTSKVNTAKARNRARGRDVVLPKAVLKRKKSTNYWLWAGAPAAAAVLVALFALFYKYL
ncbi:Proton pump-interactor 1-like protein [Drosera capensis]